MQRLKTILLREDVLIFFFCLAALSGPAFSLMDNFVQADNVDCQTYMGVFHFNFNQSAIRRYRLIVPMLAKAVSLVGGRAFYKFAPTTFPGDFSVALSFFIVNNILMALFGLLIYRYLRSFNISRLVSILGLLVMLTCRWTAYIAGLCLVDSLNCIVMILTLAGIQQKNAHYIIWAIFLGPFAKESFIFVAPVIFFFSHVHKGRQLLYFVASGILVFSYRYLYDRLAGHPVSSGLQADADHVNYVLDNLKKLLSFHGIYDVLSNFGFWLLLPIAALLFAPGYKAVLKANLKWYMAAFMLSVLVQMLLSGSLERMFYLAIPLVCLVVALAAGELQKVFPMAKNKIS